MIESLITVVDIDTGKEEEEPVGAGYKFPMSTIYRNENTRRLDNEYGELLSLEKPFTPIPRGSCFSEGDHILPVFAKLANYTGFYFGVEKDVFHKERQKYISACVNEGTVKIIPHNGNDIVIPILFK